eukprot:INCI6250.1.p1 GENE.INCI6250.1~~INCI6250.1.p1  ORF type:complete len:590 (+),score=84.52 INCI6250.1:112-1881(+)
MEHVKDPVVREFDVVVLHPPQPAAGEHPYLRASNNTYIVQYPTRIKHFAQQRVDDVTFQPLHEKLETKVGSIRVHTDPGSAFRHVAKTTFRSRKVPTRTQYAIATVTGGRVVLKPVKAVLQMQPVFDYIDNAQVQEDSARQETAAQAREDALASQTRILGTSYKVRETNKSRTRKLKSFGYMKSLERNDLPLPLDIVRNPEPIGTALEGPAPAATPSDKTVAMPAEEFCQRMCMYQSVGAEEVDETSVPGDKLSTLALQSMSTAEKVAEVLRCGHVVEHADLARILRRPLAALSDHDIAALALDAGHLIQGHWVVKSVAWYKIPYHATCRDYILKKFEAGEPVKKVELHAFMKDLSPTILEIMLDEISVFEPSSLTWHFKRACDKVTQGRFEDHAAASTAGKLRSLAELTRQIGYGITIGMGHGGRGGNSWGSAGMGGKRRGGMGGSGADKRGRGGARGRANMEDPLTPAGYAIHRIMERLGIARKDVLRQALARAQKSNSTASFPETEIDAALQQLCLEVRGRFLLRNTGDPTFDSWRAIVVGLFKEKEHLRRKEVVVAVQAGTGASLPNTGYKKTNEESRTHRRRRW